MLHVYNYVYTHYQSLAILWVRPNFLSPLISQDLLPYQKDRLMDEFVSSSVKTSIHNCLHRYLHYNHYHLPMYARPDILWLPHLLPTDEITITSYP